MFHLLAIESCERCPLKSAIANIDSPARPRWWIGRWVEVTGAEACHLRVSWGVGLAQVCGDRHFLCMRQEFPFELHLPGLKRIQNRSIRKLSQCLPFRSTHSVIVTMTAGALSCEHRSAINRDGRL